MSQFSSRTKPNRFGATVVVVAFNFLDILHLVHFSVAQIGSIHCEESYTRFSHNDNAIHCPEPETNNAVHLESQQLYPGSVEPKSEGGFSAQCNNWHFTVSYKAGR